MLIGVPKEIKSDEYRIGLTPESVEKLTQSGHEVLIEQNAGLGIGKGNEAYEDSGAEIVQTREEIFQRAEMIVKVKEPQLDECALLRPDQILFTYLHLAPDPEQVKALLASGCRAIAYESVKAEDGTYPLLTPMSEVAGRMAVQAGATCLEKAKGGLGRLIGGVTNVEPAEVVVIGGGVVGYNSIEIAIGMQANVTVLDKSAARLNQLESIFGDKLNAVIATQENNQECIKAADIVIGAVLVPGASAPKLISRELVKSMKEGSVLVDVAIDQGGCSETSRPTTHSEPTYEEEGVLHYCVANMPGAVPMTSTYALNNATIPYVLSLANNGFNQALSLDEGFCEGLNIHAGRVTITAVADELEYEHHDPIELIKSLSQ
ncbi:MAG: alanine dehydrogenase [Gammaproteobacteria bacterium]|jgi:alanine dehydrogenase|nr:alanine dehydrogenase [Gammaproteobacteria bacterium]HJM08635.1 alanine dehydrogenase [Gammaproteobacteria bacterium]|tara:strand:- start:219 stop:1346 length:1128 start_codon:yes stop_codon:yes gene_type:complete